MGWNPLIDLYIFGDIYGLPDFQAAAINLLMDKYAASSRTPAGAFLSRTYRQRRLFAGLNLNWLVQDFHARFWSAEPKLSFEGKKKVRSLKDFLNDFSTAN